MTALPTRELLELLSHQSKNKVDHLENNDDLDLYNLELLSELQMKKMIVINYQIII